MHEYGTELRPRLLSQLVALADHGDLALAADALHSTPRAVSKAVRDLERDAGESLIRHADRRVTLTPAGAAVVESARRLLDALDQFKGIAAADASMVRLAHVANADTASKVIDHVVPAYRRLRIEEHVAPDHRQLQDLLAHRLDVAICGVEGALPGGLGALLLRLDPLVVATRGRGAVLAPVDAGRTPLLAPIYGAAWPLHDALIDRYAHATGCSLHRVPVPAGSGREIASLLRAAHGRGVLVASSALEGSAVDVSHLLPRQPYLGWYLVWRRADEGSGKLRDVICGAQEVSRRCGWDRLAPQGGEPWLQDGS